MSCSVMQSDQSVSESYHLVVIHVMYVCVGSWSSLVCIRLSVSCLLIKLVVFLHKACINLFDPFFSLSSVLKAPALLLHVFYLRD
jgi:hypothetical protein